MNNWSQSHPSRSRQKTDITRVTIITYVDAAEDMFYPSGNLLRIARIDMTSRFPEVNIREADVLSFEGIDWPKC